MDTITNRSREGPKISSPYRALCQAVEVAHGTIKLGRPAEGWTLHIVLGPTSTDSACRAAGMIFPDISELHSQAWLLYEWIKNIGKPASGALG